MAELGESAKAEWQGPIVGRLIQNARSTFPWTSMI